MGKTNTGSEINMYSLIIQLYVSKKEIVKQSRFCFLMTGVRSDMEIVAGTAGTPAEQLNQDKAVSQDEAAQANKSLQA